jgi:hypothetical protein
MNRWDAELNTALNVIQQQTGLIGKDALEGVFSIYGRTEYSCHFLEKKS